MTRMGSFVWVVACAVAQLVPPSSLLETKIAVFDIVKAPMLEAVRHLRDSGLRVTLEEVELSADRDRIFNDQDEPVGVRKTEITIHLTNKTLREVLDSLTTADREYEWKSDVRLRLISILPRAGSVLNWRVPKLNMSSKGRLQAIQEDLSLQSHQVSVFWRGPYEAYDRPISLATENIAVLDALNMISLQDPSLCWTLAGFKGGRILTFVPCAPS